MHDRPERLGRLARSTPLRWIAAAVVVAAVAAAWIATRHTSPGYRTATATAASVSQTVSGVGTLQPLAEDDLAFATAGTVATVGVTVGEQVGVGQEVASLSTAPLQQAVDDAQATLAAAQARLAADEAAQAGTSSTTTATATAGAATTTPAAAAAESGVTPAGNAMLAAFTPGGGYGGSTTVASAQAALVAAQHALDLAEATESTDLQAATTTCNDALASGSSTPASACTAALATVTADHRAVDTSLAAVATAESALADAIAAAQHTTTTTTTTTPPATPAAGSASTNRTAPSTSSGSTRTPASTVTPQQVAVDQASVDQAQAQLTSTQTDLADATLASPIAGTVASVGLVPGQAVQAGSTSATIVVIGQGTYRATVDIPVASIASVATGQKAVVVPDATDRPLPGTVSSIGALPVSSSGSTDYPVTVALGSVGLPLGSGGSAQVTITVRTAAATVTVPTSAIHTFGARHLVDRLVGGTVVTTSVGVGVVGPARTQITSGLSDGSQVVLADLNAPLPVSTTSTPGLARAIAGGGRFGPPGG